MSRRVDLGEERWTVATRELAHVLGILPTNIRRLALEGMPKVKQGRWHLPSCVQWMLNRQQAKTDEIDLDLGKRKAHLYESQEQKNRIDIAEKLGHLVPTDEVEQFLAQLTQAYVDSLESIPSRLDASADVIAAVESEIRAARRDLAAAVRHAGQQLRGSRGDSDSTH